MANQKAWQAIIVECHCIETLQGNRKKENVRECLLVKKTKNVCDRLFNMSIVEGTRNIPAFCLVEQNGINLTKSMVLPSGASPNVFNKSKMVCFYCMVPISRYLC